jgi:flavorubredoxin
MSVRAGRGMMADVLSPRELMPGIHWLPGRCIETPLDATTLLHSYNASYLVAGDRCSLLVDPSHPSQFETIGSQLDELFAAGVPQVRYVFLSHWELPHAGSTALILERYPSATVIGDLSDFHLMFPWFSERTLDVGIGDGVDLGGTEFVLLQSILRDAITTCWGFDTRRGALFPADGFGYLHYHGAAHCGKVAEEVEENFDLPEMAAIFADAALYWTRFVDVEPYIAELERVLEELSPAIVCPTHGLPITDLRATLPLIESGIRSGGQRTGLSLRER